MAYSYVHDHLTPPLWRKAIRFAYSILAWLPPAIVANALCLRSAFRSVVIFVKYREVSTRTILPNFIDLSAEAVLYSRRQKGEEKKHTSGKFQIAFDSTSWNSPGQVGQFPRATKKGPCVQHSRLLQLLCTVGGNQAKLDAHSEFKFRQRGMTLVVHIAVIKRFPGVLILRNIFLWTKGVNEIWGGPIYSGSGGDGVGDGVGDEWWPALRPSGAWDHHLGATKSIHVNPKTSTVSATMIHIEAATNNPYHSYTLTWPSTFRRTLGNSFAGLTK
jgi:hypothetical protein